MRCSRCSRPPSRSFVNARPGPTTRCPSTRMRLVVLRIGQAQDLSPERERLVELAAVAVQAGEAAEDREELRDLALALEELQRAPVLLLDLVGNPWRPSAPCARLVRSVSSCSARSRSGRRGREDVQQLASSDRPCPGTGPVDSYRSQRLSTSLLSWSRSRSATQWRQATAQVLGVGGHRGQRGVAPVAGQVLPLPASEVREVAACARRAAALNSGISSSRSAAYSLIVSSITSRESPSGRPAG